MHRDRKGLNPNASQFVVGYFALDTAVLTEGSVLISDMRSGVNFAKNCSGLIIMQSQANPDQVSTLLAT